MNRREAFLATLAVTPLLVNLLKPNGAWAEGVDVNAVLHDPEAPTGGNPNGDLTIVTFFDYNCPFCKKAEPELAKVVRQDGKIRLVFKDWPILTEASVYGAQMALAAKYQGKYQAAHDALLAIPGMRIPKERMAEAVRSAGIDMARLEADLQEHTADITALLQRNLAQADSMGLQGTPVYLIGPLKVAEALDADGFRKAVTRARERQRPQ